MYAAGMSEPAASGFDLDPGGRVRPEFVRSDADRERWDLCVNIAMETWKNHDPGVPSGTWMYYTPRSIYFSDVPTGTPGDAEQQSS